MGSFRLLRTAAKLGSRQYFIGIPNPVSICNRCNPIVFNGETTPIMCAADCIYSYDTALHFNLEKPGLSC